jgi:hypothetical protein
LSRFSKELQLPIFVCIILCHSYLIISNFSCHFHRKPGRAKFKDIPPVDKELEKLYNKNKAPIVDLVTTQTHDPFKILVATILSARTKDQTTALVIKKLFKKVSKYQDFRKLTIEEVEELIFPAGFYHTKAKHLKQLPDALDNIFNGKIPDTVEELFRLYDKLFYTIPVEGETNSHQYILKESSKLATLDRFSEEIQPLLDEISQLRRELLASDERQFELDRNTEETVNNPT